MVMESVVPFEQSESRFRQEPFTMMHRDKHDTLLIRQLTMNRLPMDTDAAAVVQQSKNQHNQPIQVMKYHGLFSWKGGGGIC